MWPMLLDMTKEESVQNLRCLGNKLVCKFSSNFQTLSCRVGSLCKPCHSFKSSREFKSRETEYTQGNMCYFKHFPGTP